MSVSEWVISDTTRPKWSRLRDRLKWSWKAPTRFTISVRGRKAAVRLTKGTIEIVPVDVLDRTQTVGDLGSSTPVFDVLDSEDNELYTDEPAAGVDMQIQCLLDTTTGAGVGGVDPWPNGQYRLFVQFTVDDEIPRLGPVYITLSES